MQWVDRIRATPVKDLDHIPVLYIQGGNGSGKTRSFMAPVAEMLTEINGIRILWGRCDFKDLKLSVMDSFFTVMPSELLINKNESYHYYDYMQPANGKGRIYFIGLKDLTGLGSQEFAVIVITEAHEITEQVYRALKRRCRQAGMPTMILMESEPPNETHCLSLLTDETSETYDPDVELMEVSTYENWDNLSPAYRGSLESMPEQAKRKYILGKTGFNVSGKPYYAGFKDNWHSGCFECNSAKELLLGFDYGYHFPCCLVTQIDTQDRWIWLREIMGRDITIQKFGAYVKDQLNIHYPEAYFMCYGDPAGNHPNDQSEETSAQILKAHGFDVKSQASTYRDRKEIIEGKLAMLIGDKPALLVDKRYCKVAIDGFLGGYHYAEYKPGQAFSEKFEIPFADGFY